MEYDLPRKKGIRRFFEILFYEFRGLVKLNLLFCICVLPSASLFLLGMFGLYSGIMFALAVIAAYPIGGAAAAYSFCVARMMRDERGLIWGDFKRKFMENMKQAAPAGVLCTVFVYMQIYVWRPFLFDGAGIEAAWLITGIVLYLIFGMIAPYIFLQLAYVDLRMGQIVMNSVLISFANALRSIMGAVCGGVTWLAFILFLPDSLAVTPLLFLIGFSLSWLLCLMWVWPPVNKQFNIEKTLRERNGEVIGNS